MTGNPCRVLLIAGWVGLMSAAFGQSVAASTLVRPAIEVTQGASGIVLVDQKAVPRDLGQKTRQIVDFQTTEAPGTIIISNADRTLHIVLGNGKAARYDVSVGRDGFTWAGTVHVGRKAKWPEWRPPAAMRQRDPGLPDFVPAGPYNPLGARALYLYGAGGDTLYRIHGTNNAPSVGGYETSGCFRLTNADVIELFESVPVGTKVVVK
jgi:lipoprotein-anchoring transpeptidase ErfK/SrfK